MTPTIVLYDIDGTLVTTGGAGRRALKVAFERAYDRPGVFDFSFAGMTDRSILRCVLQSTGLPHDDTALERVLDAYLTELRREVDGAETYVIHDGMVESVEALRSLPDVVIGLGTGNVEAGARIKLDRGNLNDYFEFGGFGCDAEDRAELIAAGAHRGAERLGVAVHDCRLVIIGDTPKDVAAAHANGGECIAVATGGSSREELEVCGARWVFDDFSTVDIVNLLGQ